MSGIKSVFIIPILLIAIIHLSGCVDSAKEDQIMEKTIFTNDVFTLKGRVAGLPDGWNRVYISQFADFIMDYELHKDFDKDLRDSLKQLGIMEVTKIPQADAVVSGSLLSLTITTTERATNLPGLIYMLMLNYSVNDNKKSFLQKDKPIVEEILVLDTNAFTSNDVVPIILKNAADHTAQGIQYGWQLDYSKTADKVITLGATNETNNGTNWAK